MGSAGKAECLVIAAELYGAHNFSYKAGRHDSCQLIRARLFYVQKILDTLLNELVSSCKSEHIAYFSRGSGRFDLILREFSAQSAERFTTAVFQLNKCLLERHAGELALISYVHEFALNKGAATAQYLQALQLAQSAIRCNELEVFKDDLEELFASRLNEFAECKFCGRENLPIVEIELDAHSSEACVCCSAIVKAARQAEGSASERNGLTAEESLFLPAIAATESKLLQKAEEQTLALSNLCKHLDERPEAALHFAYWHKIEQSYLRGARVWDPNKRNEMSKTFLSECNKIMARSATQQLFILEANDDNAIVCGKLAALFELSFAFSELMDKQMPYISYCSGLAHSAHDLPLNWLIGDAVKLAQKAREAGSGFNAVHLGGDTNVASGCFSWADWRQTIKPLIDKIRHFDHLGTLGFGFWDYLLDFARTHSVSIYPLLYRLARREESHASLRRDASWQKFKADILVSLAGKSSESMHKRKLLKAALACFLLFKTLHSTKQKHLHEPVLLERR